MLSTNILPIGRYSFLYVILLRYNIYPALVLFQKSNCIDLILFVIYGYWPRYSFSGSWFMYSNGKKRKQYKHGRLLGHHKAIIRTTLMFALFRQFVFFLHCRINNIKCICTRWGTDNKFDKGSLFYLFLNLVQINFTFSDNVRILSICKRIKIRILLK